jgi:hypothetical protein
MGYCSSSNSLAVAGAFGGSDRSDGGAAVIGSGFKSKMQKVKHFSVHDNKPARLSN